MSIVSIFRKGNHRAIRLPRDLDFEGVSILAIIRGGDSIILHPVRPTWTSLEFERAEPVFMTVREDVVIKDDPTLKNVWMFDTCISSFIMREQPDALLRRLEQAVFRNQRICCLCHYLL